MSGLEAWLTDRLRRSGQVVECDIAGTSMGAGLPAGSVVRIVCDGAANASVDTVVALQLGGALTVHRVVHRGRSRRAHGWVVTEGDGNLTCDAPVPEDDLVGHVAAVRESSGNWRPIATAAPRPHRRAIITRIVRRAICATLELHPRAALLAKRLVVLLMRPVVWLRPYPAGAVRHASVAHRRQS